jgi:quinol monooxygenase YgiN
MSLRRRFLIPALVACAYAGALHAQADQALYVVRYVEAVPASQGQVATMLKQLAEGSRTENPVRFEVLESTTVANQFLVLEVWKDQAALDAHNGAAPARQFRERVAPLLRAPLDERLCITTIGAPPRAGRGGIYVVTHVDVAPPTRDAAVMVLQAIAEQSRKDPGNVGYDIVHQKDRTNHFTTIGVWTDQKADDSHQLAPHTMAYRTKIAPMLGALYDQRWYRPL